MTLSLSESIRKRVIIRCLSSKIARALRSNGLNVIKMSRYLITIDVEDVTRILV